MRSYHLNSVTTGIRKLQTFQNEIGFSIRHAKLNTAQEYLGAIAEKIRLEIEGILLICKRIGFF